MWKISINIKQSKGALLCLAGADPDVCPYSFMFWGGNCIPAHKPEELDELFVQALHSGDVDALIALYEPEACFNPEPG
jgi:hypothetical protein